MKLGSRGVKIVVLAAAVGTGLVSTGDYAGVQTEEQVIKIVAKNSITHRM